MISLFCLALFALSEAQGQDNTTLLQLEKLNPPKAATLSVPKAAPPKGSPARSKATLSVPKAAAPKASARTAKARTVTDSSMTTQNLLKNDYTKTVNEGTRDEIMDKNIEQMNSEGKETYTSWKECFQKPNQRPEANALGLEKTEVTEATGMRASAAPAKKIVWKGALKLKTLGKRMKWDDLVKKTKELRETFVNKQSDSEKNGWDKTIGQVEAKRCCPIIQIPSRSREYLRLIGEWYDEELKPGATRRDNEEIQAQRMAKNVFTFASMIESKDYVKLQTYCKEAMNRDFKNGLYRLEVEGSEFLIRKIIGDHDRCTHGPNRPDFFFIDRTISVLTNSKTTCHSFVFMDGATAGCDCGDGDSEEEASAIKVVLDMSWQNAGNNYQMNWGQIHRFKKV